MKFRPMLAAKAESLDDIKFPCFVSPKLDGIRCIMRNGVALSRTGKPLPNKFIQLWAKTFDDHSHGLDGEIIVGDCCATDVYRVTNSAVMSHEGEPDFEFHVFDNWLYPMQSFKLRNQTCVEQVIGSAILRLRIVDQYFCEDKRKLEILEGMFLQMGYEGIITRSPVGLYKDGRSTLNQQWLVKLKRFEDGEAEIIGFEELMHNENETELNELGYTHRSSHQANLTGGNTLGSIIVRDCVSKIEFSVGTGFSEADRRNIWAERNTYLGNIIKYKYFPVGVKDKPRHPVYLGLRDAIDL